MRLNDLMNRLNQSYPPNVASSWDNVGVLLNTHDDINNVLIALDVTHGVIDEAIELGVDTIITHHPIIFSPLKQIDHQAVTGSILIRSIQNNLNLIAIHTNYDVSKEGMTEALAKHFTSSSVHGLIEDKPGYYLGFKYENKLTLEEFEAHLEQLSLQPLRKINHQDQIKFVCVIPGSGSSYITTLQDCDAIITSDITYHKALDATMLSSVIYDIGHDIERFMVHHLKSKIKEWFPTLETHSSQEHRNPYTNKKE
jgi:dinuclear metal center YbgI/SA1388 family protein